MSETALPSYQASLRRLRPALIAVACLSALANLLMLIAPLYMLQVYDRVLGSGSTATLQGLFVIVVVLFGFLGAFDFLRTRILGRAGHRIDADLGEGAFRIWLRQPALTGEGANPGQALRDVETMRGFLASPAILALCDLPWVPFYLGLMFVLHPYLGLLTLGGAVVVGIAALLNRRLAEPGLAAAAGLEGQERGFADRGRQNAELIAAFGMGGRVARQWREIHDRRLATAQSSGERSEGVSAFSKTFRMFLQSAMLTLAAWLVLRQELSAGMIIASSTISGKALAPVDQIIAQWRAIGRARGAHARLAATFAGQPSHTRTDLPAPTGMIRVDGVTKLAPGQGPLSSRARILDRVSFELEPGDGLGVIGPSASGKSTLARVLIGAWTPETGEIRLDGATPDQWDPETLGRHLGYLPQTVELLPGTIRDNIARFDPWAEDEHVIAAAKIAGVHDLILTLPQGYETRAGADCPLSGGQIQRLGLARAIFGTPRIIVLDEPNSNLDQEGDEALRRAILAMREKGSTVIVMAHRPSAIAAVNKVLVLQGGRVAQFGPRETVLAPAAAPQPGTGPGGRAAGPVGTGVGTAAATPLRPVAGPSAVPARPVVTGPVTTGPASGTASVPSAGQTPTAQTSDRVSALLRAMQSQDTAATRSQGISA
ncbi:type I secretion system permease/ATPase [Frigidibacter sp. MR17.14]|uniref:type I secretion system permease/ATPase n=1 Tax=Frigidibacter sp. MR17.14 TaxID=3126509 RepID=UPI0030130211